MDWTAQVDNYCERVGPGLWAEPINAVTNLFFLVAAFVVFPRIKGDRGAELLAVSVCIIGICSGLFHTLATQWAGLADSLSILVFILIYIFLATQRVLGRDKAVALLAVVAFIPYAIAAERGLRALFGPLNGSTQYIPVLILIAAYGLFARSADARKGLWAGAAILAVSLTFRSVDEAICTVIPIGTHFLWHVLNGLMLGWMVLVIHRAGISGGTSAGARSGVVPR